MRDEVDLIQGLKENDTKTVDLLRKTLFPRVKRQILNNSGTPEDAEDMFNSVILTVLEKIENDTLTVTCKFSTYFMAICKNLWQQELRKRKQMPAADDFMLNNFADTPYNPTKDQQCRMLYSAVEKLDAKSAKLIMLMLEGKSNSEIAKLMNFKNTQAVADKKHSCMKKLVKMIAQSKDDF